MSEETVSDGAISPAGRFMRMEAALERIEQKLDAKADLVRLEALERHITDLETGRVVSPTTQVLMGQFQQALQDIDNLKRDQDIKEASLAAEKEAIKTIADTRYGSLKTLVAVATVINGVIVAAVTILTALHVI